MPNNPHNSSNSSPAAGLATDLSAGAGLRPPPLLGARRAAWTPLDGDRRRGGATWLGSELVRSTLSFFVSLLVHLTVLIALAFIVAASEEATQRLALIVAPVDEADQPTLAEPSPTINVLDSGETAEVLLEPRPAQAPDAPNIPSPLAQPQSAGVPRPAAEQARLIPSDQLLLITTAPVGGGFEGRTRQQRARLVAERGGSPESEAAVESGLAWLADHQRPDGSWRLIHTSEQCDCRHAGHRESANAATALALLPFLGAGYTHVDGPYRQTVRDGLDFLTRRMVQTPHGGDLQEGFNIGMYTHGIATLALCEAYAMTDDEQLRPFAEQAVKFICTAQSSNGGWRYKPGQAGDTTVTGWQVMALKSARMAQLEVPSRVVAKAQSYLDSVSTAQGAFYGYQTPRKEAGPTSVALLLRMYLGWPHTDDRLERGATYLAATGPSPTDMYFNYYATQVLHHYGGNDWPRWNERMRDLLVAEQAPRGHEKGSWFFPDRHGSIGGRHYTTAVCIMILEVYYRHMPLYGARAVDEGF